MLRILKKYQTCANRIFTECKEYQNIHVFAFLEHLQAYLGIFQIFLSAFPTEFLKFPRVCPCEIVSHLANDNLRNILFQLDGILQQALWKSTLQDSVIPFLYILQV